MITKLVFCVRKRADLTFEDFADYWRDRHGPLVRSLWERGTFPGMLKYVQSHTLHGADGGAAARGTKPAYDGITEVWMDSERGATDEATKAASEVLNSLTTGVRERPSDGKIETLAAPDPGTHSTDIL